MGDKFPLAEKGRGATVGVTHHHLKSLTSTGTRGELSKTRANEALGECIETVLVVQGEEDKAESKTSWAILPPISAPFLTPDAKLHRRESRANAFTNL